MIAHTRGQSSNPVPLSVVVPAHNEERVIEERLRTLLADSQPGEFDVVVVCNGCTDRTADVARRVPGTRVVERAEPGKHAAIMYGDALVGSFPRIYLDADVALDTHAARLLGRMVAAPGVLAAGPQRRLILDTSAWVVRAYYSVWVRLPQVADGLFGRGVIAVSEAGYERVRKLPLARSDDLAIHLAFRPDERRIVPDATVVIWPPRTSADLFRRRVRALQGTLELRDAAATIGSRGTTSWSDLAAVLRKHPPALAAIPVFLAFALGAKAAVRWGRYNRDTWLRDESSRGRG
jgi:glycosyltransferase involved in cell wall biosynthesis